MCLSNGLKEQVLALIVLGWCGGATNMNHVSIVAQA
jgi:hypothetical protein